MHPIKLCNNLLSKLLKPAFKDWTKKFQSLVVFTIGENNDKRLKLFGSILRIKKKNQTYTTLIKYLFCIYIVVENYSFVSHLLNKTFHWHRIMYLPKTFYIPNSDIRWGLTQVSSGHSTLHRSSPQQQSPLCLCLTFPSLHLQINNMGLQRNIK